MRANSIGLTHFGILMVIPTEATSQERSGGISPFGGMLYEISRLPPTAVGVRSK